MTARAETPTAAVAVVLRNLGNAETGPEVLLGVRRKNPSDPWSGHIAFPGGRREPEDSDLLDTAIRECREESTVELSRNLLMGALPAILAGGREHPTMVQPWIFRMDDLCEPCVGDGEIEHWFWFPLCDLDNPELLTSLQLQGGQTAPGIRIEERILWGMTLSVLRGLWDQPLCTPSQLWLDYDGTLYPDSHPLVKAVDDKITQWVAKARGLTIEQADIVRRTLYSHHGNTLQGMMREDDIDPHAYLDFVFDLPDAVLPPHDGRLVQALSRISIPTVLFTNARADYALRGLISLGIESFILRIHDIESFVWKAKPNPSIYFEMLVRENIEPKNVLFADDRWDNLLPSMELGMFTVWIDEYGQSPWMSEVISTSPNTKYWKLRYAHELSWILIPRLGRG